MSRARDVAGTARCIVVLEPGAVAYDLPPLTRLNRVLLHREQDDVAWTVPIVAPLLDRRQMPPGGLIVSIRGGALQLSRAPLPGELCLEVHYEAWRWVNYRMAFVVGNQGS